MRRAGGAIAVLVLLLLALWLFPTGSVAPTRPSEPGVDRPDPVPPDTPGPAASRPAPPKDERATPPAWVPPELPPDDPPEAAGETVTLSGQIVRADGEPASDATIHFLELDANNRWVRVNGTVRPDGSFTIEGIRKELIGASIKVFAGRPGWINRGYNFTDAGAPFRVVLRKPVTYRGRVVDEDGSPVPAAALHAYFTPYDSFSVRTKKDGTFSFLAPHEWAGLVHIWTNDRPAKWVQLPGDAVDDTDLGDLRLPSAGRISGLVLDVDGRPKTGVYVSLYAKTRGRYVGRARTDAQGRFALGGIGSEPHDATVLWKDAEGREIGARALGLRAGRRDVRLTGGPAYPVVVRLVHAKTKKPVWTVVANTSVRHANDEFPWRREWRRRRTVVTFRVYRTGRHEVSIGTPFIASSTIVFDVVPGKPTEVDLPMTPHEEDR